MFEECISLEKLEFNGFNIDKVSNMSCMFCQYSSLKKIDISSFAFNNVSDISFMFMDVHY